MKRFLGMLLAGTLVLGGLSGCEQAEFVVSPLTITPSQVVPGEPFTVSAEIANVGNADGVYTATLTVNGAEVATKDIAVASGVTETVSFTLTEETPGSYTVALNDLTASFTVLKLPSVDEVVAGMVAALEELTTWCSEFSMDMDIDISRPERGHATLLMSGKGTINLTDREMEMEMSMLMAVPDEETQEIQMTTYCIVDTMYFMMGIPGQMEQWQKLTLPGDASEAYWETAARVLSVSADMLESCNFELPSIGEASGVPCYVLEGSPDMWELFKLMPYQTMGPTQAPLFDVQEMFQGMFQDTKVSYWVTRDSYNLVQSKMTASIFMDLGDTKVEGDMGYTQGFYDYGTEVHIELPPEAEATAEELLPVPAPAPTPTPTPTPTPAPETVVFADEKLDAAIRDALDKPAGEPITPAEMAGLTKLQAVKWGITDLSGIEYCINLIELDLRRGQISDLSPLASLTNLTVLNLRRNQISDLSPLASLTNLTWLRLGNNQISDVSPLASLTNLVELGLGNNQISDVSSLASLTNLPWLDLQENQISDISPLASLTNLTYLNLRYNQISDVSPLASLTNLVELNLWNNQISDLSPLASLTNLTWLDLRYNQISDVSPLASLTNLTYLNLQQNQISDLSPLASLTKLTRLYLHSNQISDISPLVENSGLGEGDMVYLANNNLDLSEGSEDLESIRQLEARGVEVHY